jgi:hypothetical protein
MLITRYIQYSYNNDIQIICFILCINITDKYINIITNNMNIQQNKSMKHQYMNHIIINNLNIKTFESNNLYIYNIPYNITININNSLHNDSILYYKHFINNNNLPQNNYIIIHIIEHLLLLIKYNNQLYINQEINNNSTLKDILIFLLILYLILNIK